MAIEYEPLCDNESILETNSNDDMNEAERQKRFRSFQRHYLAVYLIVMGSDWVQGPYLYKLYSTYGLTFQQIAILFLTGFLSGASAGTALGSMADAWGRRKMCLLFCLISILASCSRLVNTYSILIASHVLSGTSYALMYTVFESWYVSEHISRNYPAEWRSRTFATGTFLNGLVAIIAGLLANPMVDFFGVWSPYVFATVLLIGGMILILSTWIENYGESQGNGLAVNLILNNVKLVDALRRGCQTLFNNPNILVLSAAQTLFELSMYTFVLLYIPSIQSAAKVYYGYTDEQKLPLGYLFSTMMFMVMCGSLAFKAFDRQSLESNILLSSQHRLLLLSFVIAGISFCVMANRITSLVALVLAYHLFEFATGLYYPSMSSLKAEAIPEETRASVMNLLRVPMNISVAIIFWNVDTLGPTNLFGLCSIMTFTGAILMALLYKK